jgi:hypothetical protein
VLEATARNPHLELVRLRSAEEVNRFLGHVQGQALD